MNKKTKNVLVLVVILAIIGIAVGYAALSQTLTLNGTVSTKEKEDWDVKFVSIRATKILNADEDDVTCKIDDDLTAEFTAEIYPESVVEYTVVIGNGGIIPAKLDSTNVTYTPSSNEYVDIQITPATANANTSIYTDGGDAPTHTYTVRLTWKSEKASVLPDDPVTITAKAVFNYIQDYTAE